jgi:putative ABC transport system permease protein
MSTINLKLSLRNLLKNKLYSLLSIVGFTVGFAVFLVIILFVLQEKTVDHAFKNHKNIYRLVDEKAKNCNLDYQFSEALTSNFPEVKLSSPVGYIAGIDIPLKAEGNSIQINELISTTNSFFEIFSLSVIQKLSDTPFADLNSAVITESVALKLFPNEDPLGKELNIYNAFHPVVTAVVEDFPANTSISAPVFLNMKNEKFRFSRSCTNDVCTFLANNFILLNNEQNANELTPKLNQYFSQSGGKVKEVSLQKLDDIYLSTPIEGSRNRAGNNRLNLIFLAIASIILILSVINHLNFNLSMQLSRTKSIGIRKINGALKKHLVGYYFTEASISIILSLLFALGLATLLLPYANHLLGATLAGHSLLSPIFILIVLALTALIILLNGFAPLHTLAKFNIRNFISGAQNTRRKFTERNVLTVFQFTASIILLSSIFTMSKQLEFVKSADLGFTAEHLIRINFPSNFTQQLGFKQRIDQLAFVQNSSLSNGVPGNITRILDDGESFEIKEIEADNKFLQTLGIKMVKGRDFLKGDAGNTFIFNKTAWESYEWENENRKEFQGKEVIGVMEDFNVSSLHSAMEPVCLLLSDNLTDNLSIRLTAGSLSQNLKKMQNLWKEFIPGEPLDYVFYDSYFDSLYKKEEKTARAIGILAFIALVLTCMGIFGQIFQESLNRTKEIGIRKVNGARITEVLVMLNKDFIKWVIIAFVIATPIAYYAMNKWLENFAYKTELSWWIFALAGLLALGIALLTVSWQSWKAATRNPVEALRYE